MIPEESTTNLQEQRRARRFAVEAVVRMSFDAAVIEGISDNVSQMGLMFFTEQPLRVQVEFEEDGVRQTRSGRLMRLQRLNDRNTGLAIEFDDVD